MEIVQTPNTATSASHSQNYKLEFFGKGSEYFAIMIVNWLLTLVTFSLYYPWARAKKLQYVYGQTALNNERFNFSGTGKEMFKGYIKVFILYILSVGLVSLIMKLTNNPFFAFATIYLILLTIIPFAIHGALKYSMSRTNYRGIRFGYRGNRTVLVKNFYKWTFLTIITFGIYGAWMEMNLRKYTHENMRYGDVHFDNNCSGEDYFIIILKGYFLTLITFGIYMFWWQAEIFSYYINNLTMNKDDKQIKCYSTATGGDFFGLIVLNMLLIVFTLGFGTAWAEMRTQKFMCDHIIMEGDIDLTQVKQTEEEYTNALGEDALDFLS